MRAGAGLSRRSFFFAAASLATASCGSPSGPGRAASSPGPGDAARAAPYDLILRGGAVFDGTGAPAVDADVAINAGRIAAIAPQISGRARDEIDARGLAVAPGFIDIHSHADNTLFEDPRAESVLRQGVTTVVVGQDGSSQGPADPSRPAPPGDEPDGTFASIGAFLRAVDARSSAINVASMVGLGTVRRIVVGEANRPATADELRRMEALVAAALDEGACGVSSGLEYTPGMFASVDELAALCRPLAARGLPYATHMRNEDDRLLEAIDEAITVARAAGCPLQIAHLKTQGARNWSKIDAALARIDAASASGLDVTFDRYPYIAFQTGLSNLFPRWAKDGGTGALLGQLADPSQEARLREAVLAKVDSLGGWDNVMITSVESEQDRSAEGARLGAYAAARTQDPYALTVKLLTRSRGNVGMVGFAMSEDNLVRFLAHRLCMVCSDGGAWAIEGPARRGHPHPRGLGAFARVLGRYVRETGALTLPQAIRKMTSLPASRVKLSDRGRLAPGFAADVVLFDPSAVADRATFTEPFQYAAGIRGVIVGGAVALRDGERAPARTGRALRPR